MPEDIAPESGWLKADCKESEGLAKTSFPKFYQNTPLTLFKILKIYWQNPKPKQKLLKQIEACLLTAHAVLEHQAQ